MGPPNYRWCLLYGEGSPEGESMNDRFKFRAWNKKTCRMIDLNKITPLALAPEMNTDGVFVPFDDSYVIMQCTGLKDMRGVLIFEGDILKCYTYYDICPDDDDLEDMNEHTVKSVVWGSDDYPAFCLNPCDENIEYNELQHYMISPNGECCEIIGNIHENPELLESTK